MYVTDYSHWEYFVRWFFIVLYDSKIIQTTKIFRQQEVSNLWYYIVHKQQAWVTPSTAFSDDPCVFSFIYYYTTFSLDWVYCCWCHSCRPMESNWVPSTRLVADQESGPQPRMDPDHKGVEAVAEFLHLLCYVTRQSTLCRLHTCVWFHMRVLFIILLYLWI